MGKPTILRALAALLSLASSLQAAPASAQEVAAPEPPAFEPPNPAPEEPPSPPAVDFRYELMVGGGPGVPGAPNVVFGGGLALGAVRKVRIDANLLVGASMSQDVSTDTWPQVYGTTYLAASVRSAVVMAELSGSWRKGPVELWAGGGVHFTSAVLQAEYDMNVCHGDFSLLPPFCTGTVTVERETDGYTGSFVVAPMLGLGARLPLVDHVLVGLDVRYLLAGTSRVSAVGVDRRVGGVAASLGIVWRLGPPR